MASYQSKTLRWTLIALRVIVGVVFFYGGYVKLRDPWALFAMGIDSYHLIPFQFVEPLARTLPWFELLVGALLMSGTLLRISSTIVTLMLGVFFTAMVHADLAGQKINCGCFGPGEPISKWTLLRDGSLLAASLFVTVMAFRDARRKKLDVRS